VPGLMEALTSGPTLQAQLSTLNDKLTAINESLQRLRGNTDQAKVQPKGTIFEVQLNRVTGQTSKQIWSDNRDIIIVRALLCVGSTARYALNIGTDVSRVLRYFANTPYEIVAPDAPVFVTRGLAITIEAVPAGSQEWDLMLWCMAADSDMMVNVRQ
jgi:hypothetical protein